MTQHDGTLAPDPVEQAFAALRQAHGTATPPPDLVAQTVEALQALDRPAGTTQFHERRRLMFRIAGFSSAAAAAVVAVVAGGLWLIDRSASVGFTQVVERVREAKTVGFVLKQKVGNQPELDTRMYLRGDMLRYEIPEAFTMIVDTSRRKGLELDVGRKVARKIDLEGRVPAEALANPIERLRNLKQDVKDHVQQLADEEVNGTKCHVYQVRGLGKDASVLVPGEFTLWADARTGLPVKIHAEDAHTSLTYERFKWDEALPDELFSPAVPRGYRLEELTPAVVKPGRIYYHKGWVELYSVDPDGKAPEMQFVPRAGDGPDVYVADKAELSPDGRFLAVGYTHSTKEGGFPPYRVLLWDRTRPQEQAAEVYARPEGELESWQFSPDGRRLYVSWWQGVPDRKGPAGQTGTDVVDLQTKAAQPVKLPRYRDADGKEQEMRFAAATADGQTYLVIGDGLRVATADGRVVRRLGPADATVVANSVRLSPDGRQAVYTTSHPDRRQVLFVVPLAGGEPRALIPDEKLTEVRARWSPDGKRIAYTARLFDPSHPPFSHGGETYLRLVDPDGSNVVTLLREKVHPNGPGLELTAWR